MVHLLTFELGAHCFALRARAVRGITRAVAIAALPRAPAIVEGVVNFRGTVVPVLDIRRRFGVPLSPVALQQHLILAHAGGRIVALRVDRAVDLVTVEEGAIDAAEGIVPGVEYVAGIAKLPDGLVVIHDLDRFLSVEESEQVDAATAGRKARQ